MLNDFIPNAEQKEELDNLRLKIARLEAEKAQAEKQLNGLVSGHSDNPRRLSEDPPVENELLYRTLFELANDAIFIENLNDEVLDANPRACELMGYTRDELVHLKVPDLQAPELRGQPGQVVKSELLKNGVIFESVNLCKDGTRVAVEISNSPLRSSNLVISILRDITERKWVQKALQENETRYRSLFEDSPISLWEEDFSEVKKYLDSLQKGKTILDWHVFFLANPDVITTCLALTKIVDVNRSTLALYNATAKEMLLLRPYAGCSPSGVDQSTLNLLAAELAALMTGETSFQNEALRYTLTGESFYALIHLTLAPGFENTWSKVFVSVIDFSQRKLVEEALRQSEEKFSKAFHTSPDSITINRLSDGKYLDINQGFTHLLGYSLDDVIGRSSLDLAIWTNPGDRATLVSRLTEHGFVENLEAVFRMKNGQTCIGLMSARVIEINGEQCLLSITRDITERKQVEQALQESEIRYRRLFEDSPISLWEEDFSDVKRTVELLKAQGVTDWDEYLLVHPEMVIDCLRKIKIKDVNQKTLELYKANSKKPFMAGLDAGRGFDTFAGSSLDMMRLELSTLAQGKNDFQGEFPMFDLNGNQFISSVHVSMAPGYENSWAKIFVSVADITAQKRADQLLKTLNSVAEITQGALLPDEILRLVADELQKIGLICTVFLTDWQQNKLLVKYNSYTTAAVQAAQKLLGFTLESFFIPLDSSNDLVRIAVQGKQAFYISDPEMSILQFLPASLAKLGKPATEILHLNKSVNAPLIVEDKVVGILSVQSNNLLESDIPVVTAFANQVAANWRKSQLYEEAQQEIAARKRAEDEIRQLNQSLEQRIQERTFQLEYINKELESFSYSVSHDLRAPLRAINGFSQILQESFHDQLDQEGQGYLLRMQKASEYMAQLIDDLLQLSRLTRQEMKRSRVNFSEMSKSIVLELRNANPDRVVTVTIADQLTVEGDPHLLRVMLENLFSNAWKFTSRKPEAEIEFNCFESGNGIVFFVRDNGAGFDPRYQDKLFGAFQRLHSAEEYEGNGIGLATVQRIILRHGGRVWAEGDLGHGATFYFTLP